MANVKRIKSNFFLVLTAVIWGFAFVAQCEASDSINPFLLLGVRYILGAVSLLPIIFIFENRAEKRLDNKPSFKTTLIGGAICGVILFTASYLQQWGININPNAGKAGFITGTYTVLVPIFYFLFFKKKTGVNTWIGAACAVAGLYLLSVTDGFSNIGLSDIVLFLGAILWAWHIIVIDKFINKVSPLKFSAVQFSVCGIIGLICVLFSPDITFSVAFSQIGASLIPLLYMGVCSSGIAYTCQALGQRDADPTYSAIILSTESVFAAIGGVIFGIDSNMTLRQYIGCAVIFAAILISQFNFMNKEKTES